MQTRPCCVTGSAYSYTASRLLVPPLATAPSDFSRIVVRPPALLPGEGLLFISPWWMAVERSHHLMRSTSFRPTSGLTARRVGRCSGPYTSGGSLRMALPPFATPHSPPPPHP